MAGDDAVYIISVAAELVGMHPQTLRIYERKGLIEPYRTPSGWVAPRPSCSDSSAIQELTEAGVSLEGVRRILKLRRDNERLRYQVERLRRIIEDAQTNPESTGVIAVGIRRRNLPDVRRD